MIALYDTLAGDLRRAAEAERRNDLEERARQVRHALLIVGHLEDWIDRGPGGELAEQLKGVYASLRRRMIEAQAKRSPEMLEEDMTRILEIRAIWQKVEHRSAISIAHVPGWVQAPAYPGPHCRCESAARLAGPHKASTFTAEFRNREILRTSDRAQFVRCLCSVFRLPARPLPDPALILRLEAGGN